jgi:hypothetical protein
MTPQEKARQIRPLIVKASASLSDEDALEAVELFDRWVMDRLYTAGERISYGGKLYRVVQTHTSQADWLPDITPALYTEVAKPGEIPVWRQPSGAQDAYAKGERVWYPAKDTTVYVSLVDNNVWEPGVYGWEVVS